MSNYNMTTSTSYKTRKIKFLQSQQKKNIGKKIFMKKSWLTVYKMDDLNITKVNFKENFFFKSSKIWIENENLSTTHFQIFKCLNHEGLK